MMRTYNSSSHFIYRFFILLLCLLFISNVFAKNTRNAGARTIVRTKRSLIELSDMVEAVTNHKGTDFVGYGNWCGPGGQGAPVDSVDRCCMYHDKCYDRILATGICGHAESEVLYRTNYEWKTKKTKGGDRVTCGSNRGICEKVVCQCDTEITNCLAKHAVDFSEKNQHPVDLQDILEQL